MRKVSGGQLEMEPSDLETGWIQLSGFPGGLTERRLSYDLDEEFTTGAQVRLIRFTGMVAGLLMN